MCAVSSVTAADGSFASRQGNRFTRQRILEDFVARNRHKTGSSLQDEYGNGASLFLARISAWMRLTYLLGFALTIQLKAISVFLAASTGQRFMIEFLEVGGIATVLEILSLEELSEEDKREALGLLLHISDAGRRFKELICEHEGIRVVTACLRKDFDGKTQEACKTLLVNLSRGNPVYLDELRLALFDVLQCENPFAQRMAAQVTRLMSDEVRLDTDAIRPTIALFKSVDVQVQHEGFELVQVLVRDMALQDVVVQALIELLEPKLDFDEMDGSSAVTMHAPTSTDHGHFVSRGKNMPSSFIQQSCAAHVLGDIMAASYDVAMICVENEVVDGLLHAMTNTGHYESQRQAGHAMRSLARLLPEVEEELRKHVGDEFCDEMLENPDRVFRELSIDRLEILRWGVLASERTALEGGGEVDYAEAEMHERGSDAGDSVADGAPEHDGDGDGDGNGADVAETGDEDESAAVAAAAKKEAEEDAAAAAGEGGGEEDEADGEEEEEAAEEEESFYTPMMQGKVLDKPAAFQTAGQAGGKDGANKEKATDLLQESDVKFITRNIRADEEDEEGDEGALALDETGHIVHGDDAGLFSNEVDLDTSSTRLAHTVASGDDILGHSSQLAADTVDEFSEHQARQMRIDVIAAAGSGVAVEQHEGDSDDAESLPSVPVTPREG